MNIAMLSYHTCPLAILGGKNTGGMNVYVRELTRHLGMRGIHVDVFTRSQDEHIPQVSHDLGYGNRVVHIPAGPEFSMPKSKLAEYIPEFSRQILNFVEKKGIKYDLIYSHYWMSGIAGKVLQENWAVPMVQMFHTLGLVKQSIARSSDEYEGQYRIDGENAVIYSADKIIAATEAEKAQLVTLYHPEGNRIAIIPPGVDTCHFYPIPQDEAKEAIGIPQHDRMALFVGRIEPLKGIDTLIEAMALLKLDCGKCPHYLVIIGGDPDASPELISLEMTRLKNLCHELGLDDMVIFIGKRGQDTLPYYYSAADVLVMPSHYESFGMVALEAMACGTSVIASEVGGLAHLIKEGETGFFVPSQDPAALADCLTKLILDDELRKSIGRQAAEYTRDYDWLKITDKVIQLFKDVLN
ncbi:MAG: glycosyltransferase [Chloroflexota bacterium]